MILESTFGDFRLTLFSSVALISFDSDQTLNAIRAENLTALPELIHSLGKNQDLSYLVFRGTQKHFCTGGDHEFLSDLTTMEIGVRTDRLRAGQEWVNSLLKSPLLTIAAIDGLVLGAGVDFALAFDRMLVGPRSKMNLIFNKLGIVPDLGGLFLLSERVGYNKALELFLSSSTIRADQTELLGIGRLLLTMPETAIDWHTYLTSFAPLSRASFEHAKRILNSTRLAQLSVHQSQIAATQAALLGSEEFQQRLKQISKVRAVGRK